MVTSVRIQFSVKEEDERMKMRNMPKNNDFVIAKTEELSLGVDRGDDTGIGK